MSLPGLLQHEKPAVPLSTPTIYDIKENSEWRFEVPFGSKIEVKLLSGTAELFGTELAPQQTYTFNGTKAAIFSWQGCRIEVVGECQVEYLAEETPMITYANLHYALERLRDQAFLDGREGPRVLVLGPENAGKTSLVKLLTSYATRSGRQPVVVNLDSREGMLSVPGTLSAATFPSIIDVEQGWGSSPTNGPNQVPVKLPLVYHYGLASPEENPQFFKPILTRLALSVMSKLQVDAEIREAGCIIDTPGVISQGKHSYDIIQHIVSEFSVNAILVLGSERLYSDMVRRFSNQKTSMDETIEVVKLEKSGGCVDRDEAYMQQVREAQIREYFFGQAKNTLSPHIQVIDFSHLSIYKISETSELLTSLLPGGELEDASPPPILERAPPSSQMLNSLLAIMQANANDSQEGIRDASVMGYVFVAEVDEERRKMKVLAPLKGALPNRAMIWGSWPEGRAGLIT